MVQRCICLVLLLLAIELLLCSLRVGMTGVIGAIGRGYDSRSQSTLLLVLDSLLCLNGLTIRI